MAKTPGHGSLKAKTLKDTVTTFEDHLTVNCFRAQSFDKILITPAGMKCAYAD